MRTWAWTVMVVAVPLMARAAAPAEVRGTWVTTTGNEAISTPAHTAETMRRLRDIGLNSVYVECWKNGYTEFPSEVMEKAVGVAMRVNPSAKDAPAVQRDLLGETLIAAHRNRLNCFAWFEYGFMAAYKTTMNDLRTKHPEWMVRNADGGEVAKNGFVWMNPLRPECQDLLIGIVVEAVTKYDLDGVQLDDRIVWPSLEMGYDEYTKAAYAKEHGGKQPPSDFRDKQWCAWRAGKVTAFAKRFVRAVKAANPEVIVSLSPGPYPWAKENYLCDWVGWSKWTDGPAWDEYVPQVYRMNYAAFAKDWREQVGYMGDRKGKLVAGIRLVGDGPDLPAGDAARSAQLVRETGGGGHVWWFSRGVTGAFEKEIAGMYDVKANGRAPRPDRDADWRPAPIEMRKDAGGQWRAEHVPPGRWLAIYEQGGTWRVRDAGDVYAGGGTVNFGGAPGGAEAVELLIDRRRR